jgi:ABC-type phosphate transport system substrate-binding protein
MPLSRLASPPVGRPEVVPLRAKRGGWTRRAKWTVIAAVAMACGFPVVPAVPTAVAAAATLSRRPLTPATHLSAGVMPVRTGSTPRTASTPSGAHLTYYGGKVIPSVSVVQVLYGSGTYTPEVQNTVAPSIASFYTGITASPYFDWLSEYGTVGLNGQDGLAGSGQTIGRGSFAGQIQITPAPGNDGATIDDTNIEAELSAQISAGHLPAPTQNRVYSVYFPANKTITFQGDSSGVKFCAYHSSAPANGAIPEFYYSVLPDFTTGGMTTGCGPGTRFQNETSVSSHELVEAVTDPEVGIAPGLGRPLAWYDATNGEAGDICNAQQQAVTAGDGLTYTVQQAWSNLQDNCVVSGPVTVVAAAGSTVTDTLMSQLQSSGYSQPNVQFVNIAAHLSGTVSVPGDITSNNLGCPNNINWSQDRLAPASNSPPTQGISPFGSAAGADYLAFEDGRTGPNPSPPAPPTPTGTNFDCIDVARSSSPPRTSATGDKLTFRYYAYAMDAVSWASTSIRAPATLTQAQLLGIYNCSVTNWGQVGGIPGPIQRYFPQPGSDTRSSFTTDILGQPNSYSPPTTAQNPACPSNAVLVDENEGQQVAGADTDTAIMPYSAAAWDYQQSNSINPTLDRRGNVFGAVMELKAITTATTPVVVASAIHWVSGNHDYELDTSSTGVVTETNIKLNSPSGVNYPGIRYLFNVLNSDNNTPGYQAAMLLFGFTNTPGGAKSPICDNLNNASNQSSIARGVIQSSSFAPLNSTTNINGNNSAGSTCRSFAPAS